MSHSIIDDVSKRSKELMWREPFYGLFLIALNKKISERETKTACISKNRINTQLIINPVFWQTLEGKVPLAILKHELMHVGFFHPIMSDKYDDHELFNIAADVEINQYIEDELKGPKWMGLELSTFPELKLPPKAGTDVYYKLLKQDVGKGKSPALDNLYNSMKRGESTICSHEAWKEFEGMGDSEKKLIRSQIDQQLKEIAEHIKSQGRGTVPAEFESYIKSLYEEIVPVLDWKAYLRRFAGLSQKVFTKKTRRKPNKRFPGNPALKVKQKKNVLLARDSSASVSDEDEQEFNNEIHHIWKTGVSITVLDCDAVIHKDSIFEYDGKMKKLEKIHGRGGTSFQPVIDYLEEHKNKYSILIYFTDGECPAPTKPCRPTLWVICSGRAYSRDRLPGSVIQITR